jgi:acyl-CoA synthetase (NDP forming)
LEGEIAFLSQSGALIDSIIDKSLAQWYGFSAMVSYGNEADLDVSDLLDFFGQDQHTKAIALYLESIKDGQKFIEVASRVTKQKPIVILKGGKTILGQQAAASHTAALAGEAEVYSAAFEKAGIFEVENLDELLYVSLALGWSQPCNNDIAILTNGGAAGVLTADWCSRLEVYLSRIQTKTLNKLTKSAIINQSFSKSNPLDILGDALSDRYELAMEALLEQKDIAGLIVIQTIQVMTEIEKNAVAIIEASGKYQKPILALTLGGLVAGLGFKILSQHKIPCFSDPKTAVLAMKALIERKKNI